MNKKIESRWSHLIGFCGVGSLVRADDDLFAILDTRKWTKRDGSPAGNLIPYVDCLRKQLDIEEELRYPPVSKVDSGVVIGESLWAWRFPGWMRCPRCGLLHWLPWRNQDLEITGTTRALRCKCREPNPRLQQVGWVRVSSAGGMRDVNWHSHAHGENSPNCQLRDRLYLARRGSSTGWEVWCNHDGCNKRHDFRIDYPIKSKIVVHQPWNKKEKIEPPIGEFETRILEVGDPRVFIPRIRSALVIPPESRVQRGSIFDRLYQNSSDLDSMKSAPNEFVRKQRIRALATKYRCTDDEVNRALQKTEEARGCPEIETPSQLNAEEYKAFLSVIPDLMDGEDFVPQPKTDALRALDLDACSGDVKVAALISDLIQVTRLREVRVFEGFTRIHHYVEDNLRQPTLKDGENDEKQTKLIPPDLEGSLDWLPAIDLFGEGIFFTLSGEVLDRWAEQPGLLSRLKKLEKRYEASGTHFPDSGLPPIRSRFVLLHTLAHMLIRQLETRAGYPAASIRERIYFSQDDKDMAGILVYVAVPDIVGSLGGLAELAEPDRFVRLLSGVFSNAEWCSLDPVCNEHEGQGPNQLNLAACHACALVPETSCQFNNVLLDRVFISGSIDSDVAPLLDFVKE